jgi:hypothetical protein
VGLHPGSLAIKPGAVKAQGGHSSSCRFDSPGNFFPHQAVHYASQPRRYISSDVSRYLPYPNLQCFPDGLDFATSVLTRYLIRIYQQSGMAKGS